MRSYLPLPAAAHGLGVVVGVRGSNGVCGVIKITITKSKPNVEQHSTTFLLLPDALFVFVLVMELVML